jgi:hypothetical protein
LCITGFVVQGYRGHKNAGRKEMEFFCDQFWFCNAIPPEWHWVMPLGMPLLLIIIVAVPVANILHRAGRSRWWTILAFAADKSDRLMGVRVHPMAGPRLGYCQVM